MKVLIIGGGGREHALAWKLRSDDPSIELVAAPGNPGIATLGRCEQVGATDILALRELAAREKPDLTVVGPEAPLAAGLVDQFRRDGFPVFGPTAAAARIESSKRFAKELMEAAAVPTARAEFFTNAAEAKRRLSDFGEPLVVKASGLASGKGVTVAKNARDAERVIDQLLGERALGDAGSEILLEEFMEGEELSIFAITDGERFVTMLPSQDHKRLFDGDKGPNTGGMGAYAPVSPATPSLIADVERRIIEPTLRAMRDSGAPFTGLLYAGIMLTREGPKVVEFNCRFGDPETEAILPLMSSSLLEIVAAVANGGSVSSARLSWRQAHAATTVVAAPGYPDSPNLGLPVRAPNETDGVHVFHAGTAKTSDGRLTTAGGRVFAITAIASTLHDAVAKSRSAAEQVILEGKQMRRDIGWRALGGRVVEDSSPTRPSSARSP